MGFIFFFFTSENKALFLRGLLHKTHVWVTGALNQSSNLSQTHGMGKGESFLWTGRTSPGRVAGSWLKNTWTFGRWNVKGHDLGKDLSGL